MAAYAEESAATQFGPHGIDQSLYFKLEGLGLLIALGAFDGDTCVGFAGAILTRQTHFAARQIAQTEAIFVLKDYRQYGLGFRLLKRIKEEAEKNGATGLVLTATLGTSAEKLFERIAEPVGRVFWMEI